MKQMKRSIVFFLVIFFLFSCSGCMGNLAEQDPGTPDGGTDPAKEPEEKNLLVYYDSHLAESGVLRNLESEMSIFRGVQASVTAKRYLQSSIEEMVTDIVSGGGPDVYILSGYGGDIDTQLLYSLKRQNAFLDLSERVTGEKYLENLLEAGQWDNTQYAIPLTAMPHGMILTEETAENYGISSERAMSYAEFETLLQQFAADGLEPFAGYFKFSSLLEGAGSIYDETTGKAAVDTEAFRAAAQLYQKIYPSISPLQELGLDQTFDRMYTQQAALYRTALDVRVVLAADQILKDSGGNGIRLFPLPTPEGGSPPVTSDTLAGVSVSTSLPDDAWKFIAELLSSATETAPTEAALENHFSYYENYILQGIPKKSDMFPKRPCIIEEIRPGLKEDYQGLLRTGTGVIFSESTVNTFIDEGMQPYFEGTKELDLCIQELESRLNLYYNE